jgi:hypothetical protein
MLPQGTPGKLYTYQLNANVQSQWYLLDYSEYGSQIISGVLTGGNSLYFILDGFNILKYSGSIFTVYKIGLSFSMVGTDIQAWSTDGKSWNFVQNPLGGYWLCVSNGKGVFVMASFYDTQAWSNNGKLWYFVLSPLNDQMRSITYGNDIFVAVGPYLQAWSDDGKSWNYATSPIVFFGFVVTYGNGIFVAVGSDNTYNGTQAWSTDGKSWNFVENPLGGYWPSVTYGNGIFVMTDGHNTQAWSTDGISWNYATLSVSNYSFYGWTSVIYGNGVFVLVGESNQAWSIDGKSWTLVQTPLSDVWMSVTYGKGVFVMTGYYNQAWSIDGKTWTYVTSPLGGDWQGVTISSNLPSPPGDGFKNLLAVGNYIYCSTSNVAVQIDTSQDLSTAAAYKFPAPLPVSQYVFANGPRYVYMFAQGDPTAANIVEFDPYPPTPTLKTSILVDYESLPPEVPKPDKALIGLVQTQKVTDMNYMNIKGPVKELWVTGPSDTANVFQYSNLAARSTLTLTGEKIVTEDDGTHTFLNVIEPYETHTSMPVRNVSVISFELDPESEVPNGTVNFSRIRDQIFEGGAQTVWARNYNLLKIQGGIGGLIFNS